MMISNNMEGSFDAVPFKPEALDLQILELLVKDASIQYRELAERIGVDKRTVAKHIDEMRRKGVIRFTVDIEWPLLGATMLAFVGSQTELGEKASEDLYDYVKGEPHVVGAFTTVGSDEYFLIVLEENLQTLREDVLKKLEPLTAELTTAIVSTAIKSNDYAPFLAHLREGMEVSKAPKPNSRRASQRRATTVSKRFH
jgi:DNA-binding Lrp family transcriptional regulator